MRSSTAFTICLQAVSRRIRRTSARQRLAVCTLALIAGAMSVATTQAAAPAPVPCTAIGAGKYNCQFYVPGDGRSGGANVVSSDGRVVGYLHQGTNWVLCQRVGARVTAGAYFNKNWAWTLADDNKPGWVNAVYASGGDNDGPFGGGVPDCGTRFGAPPQGDLPVAPPAGATRYVALGDSYSSGEGASSYLPAAPGRPAKCHRSRDAYSQVLAKRLVAGLRHDPTRDFLACSGDEVPDLLRRQVGALGPDVAVITVGIGGNDAGWIDVLTACSADAVSHPRAGTGKGCNRIIADVFKRRLPILRGRLSDAYTIIKGRAPQARVIVLGYPAIFEDSLRSSACATAVPLTRGARADLRKAAGQLDGEIAAIARRFGFRFVDPRPAYEDHRVCGPKEDWLHGLTLGRPLGPGTYHPNVAGQRGFANAIAAANRDLFK